jgi:DNA modification methylase
MTIICGDCLDEMRKMEDNSISAIVTDPPYGLHFMGKDWDSFKKTNFDERGDYKYLPKWDRTHRSIYSANAVSGTYDERRSDEFQQFIRKMATEALRIVKPGGHILMFGSPRRHHRQMAGLEDAGWEIRDTLAWIYGSGFPKSHNHFGIEGYGTALKPAYEPIIMAMKKCDGTFKQNAEKWGQAGINIDGCRIEGSWNRSTTHIENIKGGNFNNPENGVLEVPPQSSHPKGRWPANVILNEEAGEMLDEQSGVLKSGSMSPQLHQKKNSVYSKWNQASPTGQEASSGGASRFFYCPKASSSERNEGLDCYITVKYDIDQKGDLWLEENMAAVQLLQKVTSEQGLESFSIDVCGESIMAQFHKDFSSIIRMKIKKIIESKTSNSLTLSPTNEFIQDVVSWMENGSSRAVNVESKNLFQSLITNGKMVSALGVSNVVLKMLSIISDEGNWKEKRSTHPTVKPLKLMEYLIKLIMPPKDGILLDPFAGSGTTVLAAHKLGVRCIGIEKQQEYCDIANARLANHIQNNLKFDL